jgi:hypothetical protein
LDVADVPVSQNSADVVIWAIFSGPITADPSREFCAGVMAARRKIIFEKKLRSFLEALCDVKLWRKLRR